MADIDHVRARLAAIKKGKEEYAYEDYFGKKYKKKKGKKVNLSRDDSLHLLGS